MWNSHLLKQQKQVEFFNKARLSDNLPHAMLLYGAEGSGCFAHACYVSQLIFCKSPQIEGPCYTCSSCKKMANLQHPDIHFLLPIIGTDPRTTETTSQWKKFMCDHPYSNTLQWLQEISQEKRQGNINARDCIQAYLDLQIQSYEGGPRILLIWMAEYLGNDGNRLLKLIEEPPENTFIILTTTNRKRILETILSRCQQFYFPPYKQNAMVSFLKEQFEKNDFDALKLAKLTEGNMNMALSMHDSNADGFDKLMGGWIKACLNKDPIAQVNWCAQISKLTREMQKYFMKYALRIFRSAMQQKWVLNIHEAQTSEEKMIAYLSNRMEVKEIEEITSKVNANVAYIGQNAYAKTMWLDTCITFNHVLNGRTRKTHEALLHI